MPYMRGDYAGGRPVGDYYRGDPSIGSFFGGIGKMLLRTGVGLATGGPLGAIAAGPLGGLFSKAIGVAGAVAPVPGAELAARAEQGYMQGVQYIANKIVPTGNPGNLPVPVGLPGTMMAAGGAMPPMLMGPRGMRRVHPNKSTYVTRGGGTSRWPVGLAIHPKGTEAVPTRRMNVANPRALRKALRRVAGFAKITKRVRRAVSMAASAVGVHRRGARKAIRRR